MQQLAGLQARQIQFQTELVASCLKLSLCARLFDLLSISQAEAGGKAVQEGLGLLAELGDFRDVRHGCQVLQPPALDQHPEPYQAVLTEDAAQVLDRRCIPPAWQSTRS